MPNENKETTYLTWQLFKKGNYYNGQITDDMLNEVFETFEKNGDVPIGIGHMNYFFDDSLPAEGWIETKKEYGVDSKGNFVSKGIKLFEPLKSMYKEGRYKNWSVVLARPRIYNEKKDSYDFGKWELRALDLLGRATPAIKGLKDMTANAKPATLSKFSLDEKDENIIKFSETGNELEIMYFSFSGEIEEQQHSQNNTDEVNTMDLQKQFDELKTKLEENSKLFAEKEERDKAEILRLTEERDKAEKKAKESLLKFAESEKETLSASLKNLPEEMKTKLFSALSETVGEKIEMTFGEETEKKTVYGILADCFNQLSFAASNDSFTSDAPTMGNEGGENAKIYSDSRTLTKKLFS